MTFEKGYHVLLDAASQIANSNEIFLVIGGDPNTDDEKAYFEQLEQTAKDLDISDRCTFTGNIAPEDFFSYIDIFCHLYLGEEGLSYAILEALTAGCPVIASNTGGPLEIISSPQIGQLIPSNDPRALAVALNEYIDNPARMSAAAEHGKMRIATQFDFEQWPTAWLDLLQRTIG